MALIRLASLLVILFISLISASAQEKLLSIDDLMNRKLYPASLSNLQWRDPLTFSWTVRNKIVQQSVKSATSDTIFSLDQLNEALAATGMDKLKALPSYTWSTGNNFTFNRDGKYIIYDLLLKKATIQNSFDSAGENTDIEPLTGRVAYTKENNLFVSDNGSKLAVTNDAEKNIVNGQSVHRNEFGIDKGTFWSPKGSLLAFYRMDQTMVTDYPLVDINERIAMVKNMKYPMAGMPSHHVTVGVFNPETSVVIFLKTGEPAEQYLTNISWSPDEKYIFIAVLNRDQDHMWLNKYDASTGEFVKTLFEETDKVYVEPLHGLSFLKTDPSRFIWESRRDGWNHLYLYDTEGNLLKQLTTGNWEVTDFLGMDPKETKVFFLSTDPDPLERHFYSVVLKSGKTTKYTSVKGTHSIFISPDGKYFIDRLNSIEVGSSYELHNDKAMKLRSVFENINPLKDYRLGETSFIKLKTTDGFDLYSRLIKPVNFDSTRKYPVLIYVYGGPHSQLVSDTWLAGAGLFLNYMAEKGYVIFTLDNRGTSNRGAGFEQCVHRQLGKLEMEDQMTGVEYLKSLPWVDTGRIGVDGWSYGGFMTLTLKLRNPGVFKVATCGGPVIDWKYYEVMYGERYMDTPGQNPEGYRSACLLNYIDNLEGKLLVMHGGQDNTVVWQNSLQFIQQCITAGKQVDYFVYPNYEHNVGGKDRLHLFRKLADYYDQNL